MPKLSANLLDQARHLARREPKRPRQASLRRSVSASYYSPFHFLIEEATALVIGTGQSKSELRHFAGRAFVHGKMKSLCGEFNKPIPSNVMLKVFWLERGFVASAEIQMVASAFRELQELRHDADYGLAKRFTRISALDAADRAAEACKAWNTLKVSQPALAEFFALALPLWPSLGAR